MSHPSIVRGRNMDRIQRYRIAYFVDAWTVVVALLVQVSLIGLWLFSGQPTLGLHMEFGHAITLMVFALLILAFTGRLPGSMRLRTALLAGLMALQTEVFAFIPGSPLRAFHPVLPLVIFFLAASLAYNSTPLVRGRPMGTAFPSGMSESRAD
jgi:hypothetical protein